MQDMSPSVMQFWEAFKNSDGCDAPAVPAEVYYFCNNEDDANALGVLVLRGIKRATTALLAGCDFENLTLPDKGDFNVITNWQGEPMCVIEITDVEIRSFRAVDADYAFREGEGDRSLAYWRTAHRDFFMRECASMHMQFDESMRVVCIGFRCVYPMPR